jgi:hypothetical protein
VASAAKVRTHGGTREVRFVQSRRGCSIIAPRAGAVDPERSTMTEPDVDTTEATEGSPDEDSEASLGDVEIPETPTHVQIHDSFLSLDPETEGSATNLRAVFDEHHDDPRRTHEHRFVWDYWHIQGQYTLLRTPAADYFPEPAFSALEFRLKDFARRRLGCSNATPLWLSCYVEGMRQELHADVPHGPWAFVLSLTNWDDRKWTGGETALLKPRTLEYWRAFDPEAVIERTDVVELVEQKFNRLTVFDPRIPHGVPVVEGVRDPKHGRLVLHGWFNEPAPFLEGALANGERGEGSAAAPPRGTESDGDLLNSGNAETETALFDVLENDVLPPLYETLRELPRAMGMVVVAVTIEADGTVSKTEWTADTLVPTPGICDVSPSAIRDAILLEIAGAFLSFAGFPKSKAGVSRLVVPFAFE